MESDVRPEHVIDRTGWPAGPWDDEPDRVEWVDYVTKLPCLLLRNEFGGWCGYVGVPVGHKAYQVHYDDIDVDVHGGLTYSDSGKHGGERPAGYWWVGFDCGHHMDLLPGMFKHGLRTGTYKDMTYAREETERLAKQLAMM